MTINSKQKGARFERLLASKFREYGYYDSRRTAQYCGNTGDSSDVVGLPMIHVEAKHQEKMYLYDWVDQAKRDANAGSEGKLPAVFHKKNNHEILVTMELDDWMKIYREYESGMTRKECETGELSEYLLSAYKKFAHAKTNCFYELNNGESIEIENALEKKLPKKPNNIKKSSIENGGFYGECPTCGKHVESLWTSEKFCCECGQKLDWS